MNSFGVTLKLFLLPFELLALRLNNWMFNSRFIIHNYTMFGLCKNWFAFKMNDWILKNLLALLLSWEDTVRLNSEGLLLL